MTGCLWLTGMIFVYNFSFNFFLFFYQELCWDPVNVQALSQNILHNQTNDDNNNVCQKNFLTPFAIYLLHGNTGPIGHRIFGRILSITTIFDKLCMNHITWRQPNSSFLHCDDGRCCTPQTNKNMNCSNSCLSCNELNSSNNDNNNKSVLSDPVNWMLDVARKVRFEWATFKFLVYNSL